MLTHAEQRCLQRYAIPCTPEMMRVLLDKIRRRNSILVYKSSNSRIVLDVEYKGFNYRVVYSTRAKRIITFLPNENHRRIKKINKRFYLR